MELFDDMEMEKFTREPDCLEGEDHDWQAPHDLVGGCESNPGVHVWGGEGVAEEVCMHCGCAKLTYWTREGTAPGEDPVESVYYKPGAYSDEVMARRAARRKDIMALLRVAGRLDIDPYEYAALAETGDPESVWVAFEEGGLDGLKAMIARKIDEVEEKFGRCWQPLMIDEFDEVWLGVQVLRDDVAEKVISIIKPRWRNLGPDTPDVAILTSQQAKLVMRMRD
jgi:hypothetical protein